MSAPTVSIIIPVYNEEAILEGSIEELIGKLADLDLSYEILIAENGSKDRTIELAEGLAARYPQVETFSASEANYGRALREGILRARGEFILCDEIDLCDVDFYRLALGALRSGTGVDFVVGSKQARGANDSRPLARRAATRILNGLLRVAVGFRGTDTHGLKAFRREALLGVVNDCVVDRDMFASELVVRVHRTNIRWLEVPIDLEEKRPPSVHLVKRVPHVLKSIVRLTLIIRAGRDL